MQHSKFLQTLFEYNEDNYILIWIYDGENRKESHWFKDWQAAAEFIQKIGNSTNVYVGVGLSGKDYGTDYRCKQNDIAGITGLWLDLDILDPAHKKPNLPVTVDDAMKLFGWLEHQPTILIHSGHGLQAYWVFNEPWTFDSDAEREDARNLSKRFIYAFKQQAHKYGWDVDSVFNLDRVLRVPGTMNCKSAPVPVKMLECNDLRYNPSDFEDILPEIKDVDEYEAALVKGDLILSSTPSLNMAKFEALKMIESKFVQSWEHQRKDLQDQSASSYDLALANYSAMAGWSEQEIANLLISHRIKHREDLKLRQDYYKRTISIAMRNAEKYRAEEEIIQMSALEPEEKAETSNAERDAIIRNLSMTFNCKILGIEKYLSEPAVYCLITSSGSINLGDVENLISQTKLRNKIAEATGKYLPRFKAERWDSIATALLKICVPKQVGNDATDKGQVSNWLQKYLNDKPVLDNADEAAITRDPFCEAGITFIYLDDLQRWIRVVQLEKITAKQLSVMLSRIGAESCTKNVKINNSWTTRYVWKLPNSFNI
ncbi:MAG: hypothetical protein GX279_09990 [Clostridiaceae bacterium]|nr:hypothetical protein [Clostridiaceae bacterium]